MQRDGSGRFLPGQSANPGGRPSGVKELRELTRQYTHEAVDVLVKHLNDPSRTTTWTKMVPLSTAGS